jgi:uncharacterized protein (UPF0332 family)
MFDPAQAALMRSGADTGPNVAKTHSGVISAFSLHLVKSGRFSIELGRSFNRVAEIRLVADYTGDEVSMDKSQWAVEKAAAFVKAIQREFPPQ